MTHPDSALQLFGISNNTSSVFPFLCPFATVLSLRVPLCQWCCMTPCPVVTHRGCESAFPHHCSPSPLDLLNFSSLLFLQVKMKSFLRSLLGSFLLSWQQQWTTWPMARATLSRSGHPRRPVPQPSIRRTAVLPAGCGGTLWTDWSAGGTPAPGAQGSFRRSISSPPPPAPPHLRGGAGKPQHWCHRLRATPPPTTTPTPFPPAHTETSPPAGSSPPRPSWKKYEQLLWTTWLGVEELRPPPSVEKTVARWREGRRPGALSPTPTGTQTPPSTTTCLNCQSSSFRSWSWSVLHPGWGSWATTRPSARRPIRTAPPTNPGRLGAPRQVPGRSNTLLHFTTTAQQGAQSGTTPPRSSLPQAEPPWKSPSSTPPTRWAWTTERTDPTAYLPTTSRPTCRMPPPNGPPGSERSFSWTTPTPPTGDNRQQTPPTTPGMSELLQSCPRGDPPPSTCSSSPPPHRSLLPQTIDRRGIWGVNKPTLTPCQTAGCGDPKMTGSFHSHRGVCLARPVSNRHKCLPFQRSHSQTTQLTTEHTSRSSSPLYDNSTPSCLEDNTTGTHRRRLPCKSPCCCDLDAETPVKTLTYSRWHCVEQQQTSESGSLLLCCDLWPFMHQSCRHQPDIYTVQRGKKGKNWLKCNFIFGCKWPRTDYLLEPEMYSRFLLIFCCQKKKNFTDFHLLFF